MKKIKLLLIFIGIFILTGCVKYNLDMSVGADKSFTLSMIDAVQNEYYTENDNNNSKAEYEALGYEVEDYKTNTHTGFKITKKFDNIDLLSSSDCGQVELTNILELETSKLILFKSTKKDNITTYTADFTYDLTIDTTSEEADQVDYSEYSSTMEFTYSIALPTNATILSNNADDVSSDGYILTWTMEYGSKKDIDFVFEIDESKKGETTIKEDETPKKEEVIDEEEPVDEAEDKIKEEKEFSFKTLIFALIAIALVLGLVLLKIKTYTNTKFTSKNNGDSAFNHTAPPNIKK
ncbi:MAG: hypothetical protein IJN90_06120 [Bacilli bacterium]|nr:hypothetical protein [Bacilli bacterium]